MAIVGDEPLFAFITPARLALGKRAWTADRTGASYAMSPTQ
jgi:hypothetical protein